MLIPKEFKLFSKTFKVKQLAKVDATGSLGECDSHKGSIKLLKTLDNENKEIVYLHELVHAILDSIEYEELSRNEKFVDRFSKALHQTIITSK
jgi:hypothetical protein